MGVILFFVTFFVVTITATSINNPGDRSSNWSYIISKKILNGEIGDFDEDQEIYSQGPALLRDMEEESREKDDVHFNYHFHEIILSDAKKGCKKWKESCSQNSDCCYGRARCLGGTCKSCLKDGKSCSSTECCTGYKCVNGKCSTCGKAAARCTSVSDCCSGFNCTKGKCVACIPLGIHCGRNNIVYCCGGTSCYKETCQKGIVCGQTGGHCTGTLSGLCCSPRDTCGRDGICVRHCADTGVKCSTNFPCCNTYIDRCLGGVCGKCRSNADPCTRGSDCCWKGSKCESGRCKGCLEIGERDIYGGCKSNAHCCKKGAQCFYPGHCAAPDPDCSFSECGVGMQIAHWIIRICR